MRQCKLGNGKHGENVAPESAFHVVEVDLAQIFAHNLLSCIVDESVNDFESVNVLLDGLVTKFPIHEVTGNQ